MCARMYNQDKYNLEKELKNQIRDGLVFVRAIRSPGTICPTSIHNETFLELELRKLGRKAGFPTLTKENGTIDGNPNRSTSLIGNGGIVFGNVGYGIINPDIKNVKDVSKYNFGSGTGKKYKVNYSHANQSICEYLYRLFVPVEHRLNNLKNSYGRTSTCNEVILDIALDDIAFVFYNSDDNVYVNGLRRDLLKEFRILDAIYIRDTVKLYTGRDIPIFEYSNNQYPIQKKFSTNDICKLLKTSLKSDVGKSFNLFSPNDAKWFHSFKPYINNDAELKSLVESKFNRFTFEIGSQQIEFLFPSTSYEKIRDAINVHKITNTHENRQASSAMLISAFRNSLELPHVTVRSYGQNRFVACSFAMRRKFSCSHPGIEVRNFLEVVDAIKKSLPKEAFGSLKLDIINSFNRLPKEIAIICEAQYVKREDKAKKAFIFYKYLDMYKKPENVLVLLSNAIKAYSEKDYLGVIPRELLVLLNDCLNSRRCKLSKQKREEYNKILTDYRKTRPQDLEFYNKSTPHVSLSSVPRTKSTEPNVVNTPF